MKARRLRITAELWVEVLANPNPQRFKVVENRLPEDARVARSDQGLPRLEYDWSGAVVIWVESAAFRDDDPDDLPDVWVTAVAD